MKNLNRFALNGLRAVEAVGRLGSLAAAANELGVTPGAVSQQLQSVEKQLGRTLFDRRSRGLQLSAFGAEIMPHLTAGMRELSAGIALVSERRDDPLVVSVPPVFAAKWLVWRISAFNAAYEHIRIRVDASMEMIDMTTSDVDVCMRVSKTPPVGGKVAKLFDLRVFPVCSPVLAARLETPADLAGHPIVRDRLALFDWDVWFKPGEPCDAQLQDGPTFSDASLCLDSTIAGQGVFLGWETLASDALKAGRLAAPFARQTRTDYAYWLLEREHSLKARSIAAFTGWLRAELAASLGRAVGSELRPQRHAWKTPNPENTWQSRAA